MADRRVYVEENEVYPVLGISEPEGYDDDELVSIPEEMIDALLQTRTAAYNAQEAIIAHLKATRQWNSFYD